MGKVFVRFEIPDDEGGMPEIVMIDLARISYCELVEADDESEWYTVFDANDKPFLEIAPHLMADFADAVEQAARQDSWGNIAD